MVLESRRDDEIIARASSKINALLGIVLHFYILYFDFDDSYDWRRCHSINYRRKMNNNYFIKRAIYHLQKSKSDLSSCVDC